MALCLDNKRVDTKKIIQDEKWNMIEFYYCDRSTFNVDFAIEKEPALIMIDKNNKVIYKKEKFDHTEPWA